MMEANLITPQQVAERLIISNGSLYNLKPKGRLPFVKIFGSLRFRETDIEELVKRGFRPVRESGANPLCQKNGNSR